MLGLLVLNKNMPFMTVILFYCKFRALCPCISSAREKDLPLMQRTIVAYQEEVNKMLNNANYDSDDFAVVVQPFMNQAISPVLVNWHIFCKIFD